MNLRLFEFTQCLSSVGVGNPCKYSNYIETCIPQIAELAKISQASSGLADHKAPSSTSEQCRDAQARSAWALPLLQIHAPGDRRTCSRVACNDSDPQNQANETGHMHISKLAGTGNEHGDCLILTLCR